MSNNCRPLNLGYCREMDNRDLWWRWIQRVVQGPGVWVRRMMMIVVDKGTIKMGEVRETRHYLWYTTCSEEGQCGG